jgi:glycosyltransferase involved in cell wall biosynthesis
VSEPLVSIVMPTWDRVRFLPATVRSIFAQTFGDWELVVADDGSGVPALDYLATLEVDERVRVLRRARVGNPGAARNAAIAAARAPLLAFFDSDDVWEPTKLELQLAEMRAHPACAWCYTGFVNVDADELPLPSERSRSWTPHAGEVFAKVVRGFVSIRTPSCVMASTTLVRDVGGFDEAIDCAEDYDLWVRLALRSPLCVVDKPLVKVRHHHEHTNSAIGRAAEARDYSLCKLARGLEGPRRSLVEEERSRNALAKAAVISAHGGRWRALSAVASSAGFSWRYPRWWYGAAKALARACLNVRPAGAAQ